MPSPAEQVPRGNMGAEEECRLAVLALQATPEGLAARNRLVVANQGLIHLVAKPYKNAGVPYADLVQEGALGLMRAAETFDPQRGVRFGTYAAYWILSKVQRFVEHEFKETRPFLTGAKPVLGEDGKRHLPKAGMVSLDAPLFNDSEDMLLLGDAVTNVDEELPSQAVARHESDEIVRASMRRIVADLKDPRLKVVLERRILNPDPEMLYQVGKRLGLSRESIRNFETKILVEAKKRLQHITH